MSTIQEFRDSQVGLSTYQILPMVIEWATEAALLQVTQGGADTEEEGGMGLWQSFQTHFPPQPTVDYDILVTAYSHTYTSSVKALKKMLSQVESSTARVVEES